MLRRYYNFMTDVQNGNKASSILSNKHKITAGAYLILRELGYTDRDGNWIGKNVVTESDCKTVIYGCRKRLYAQNNKPNFQPMQLPLSAEKKASKKPIQIPNVQTVIKPVQSKSHRKDISILWGLISIKIS